MTLLTIDLETLPCDDPTIIAEIAKTIVPPGHFPSFHFSLLDMLEKRDMTEAINLIPVISKPLITDKRLCMDCQEKPRHRTESGVLARCKECNSIRNKIKYDEYKNGQAD